MWGISYSMSSENRVLLHRIVEFEHDPNGNGVNILQPIKGIKMRADEIIMFDKLPVFLYGDLVSPVEHPDMIGKISEIIWDGDVYWYFISINGRKKENWYYSNELIGRGPEYADRKVSRYGFLQDEKTGEEPEWLWCLAGNIVDSHEYGMEHEIRHGTRHFPPGAKVYLLPVYPGMGLHKVSAIGIPRHKRGYIEVVIPIRYVNNFRLQKVFKPAVVQRMKISDFTWWGNSDKDRDIIIKYLEYLAPEAAENAKLKFIDKDL